MSDTDDKDTKGKDDKDTKGKDDKGPKDDKGGGTTKEEIREVVSEVLGGLFKSGKADVHDDDDDDDRGSRRRRSGRGRNADIDDIGAQVEAAVAKVNERTAAEKKEADREARLKALEEKTAKPEKIPREYRRATRIMGWVTDDDD